ncbi:cytochrome P450 [Irpex rosettiformis]|uniref:Cytochrome P450 n=1 Tax=Irpex rosettiformis TaxID=378272 RepID=A0ACB8TXC2_9APHY|nr:cytochrome P450 [Irpex rosettiformis]
MVSLLDNSSGLSFSLHQPSQLLLYVVCLTALAGVVYYYGLSKLVNIGGFRHTRLPPGPKDRWFEPGPKAALKYERMIQEYGPVFSFRQGNKVVVVIGRFQAAVDIMQKHGGDLADRPRSVAAGEIFSGGMRTLLTPRGDRLRKLRRALHSQLQPAVTHQWVPAQWKYARMHILDLLNRPEHHIEHARRYAASVIMTLTYGKRTPSNYSDPEVQAIVKNGLELGKLLTKTHIVDIYPILKYIPFLTSDLRQGFKADHELYTSQVNVVRKQLEAGHAQQSFITYLLDLQAELGLNDDELAFLGGSMFGAGAETTASAISFAIMAACKYPEEQAKVQAQLDEVVGRERVPSKEDEPLLPRVVAFYMEVYRWRPVSWGGFAHRATQDIIWNDYVIPEGATVVGSHWCIAKDPDVYPDPFLFNPDRWLNDDGLLKDEVPFWNFGFGRRVCPGQHVANNSLFLNIALILWAFTVSEDPSGPIDAMAFMDAANTRPFPFKVNFKPRFSGMREVVETSLAQAY